MKESCLGVTTHTKNPLRGMLKATCAIGDKNHTLTYFNTRMHILPTPTQPTYTIHHTSIINLFRIAKVQREEFFFLCRSLSIIDS
jgi:hypothetical protein